MNEANFSYSCPDSNSLRLSLSLALSSFIVYLFLFANEWDGGFPRVYLGNVFGRMLVLGKRQ